jgi:hypothetical protein
MTQAQHIKSLLADHAASLRTIIHHVDLAVLRDPVYQAWMHTFDPDVAVGYSAASVCPLKPI